VNPYSRYLLVPLRTLRQACLDFSAANLESTTIDCGACTNRKLCESNERLERGRRTKLTVVPKNTPALR
jgi:hypothetical protein